MFPPENLALVSLSCELDSNSWRYSVRIGTLFWECWTYRKRGDDSLLSLKGFRKELTMPQWEALPSRNPTELPTMSKGTRKTESETELAKASELGKVA